MTKVSMGTGDTEMAASQAIEYKKFRMDLS
jgi:hypothetical protein